MCLGIAHCQEQISTGYQQFLATLPHYEDKIGKLLQRVNRFDIPAERLAGFQAMYGHHFPVELRKGETHVVICSTCGVDVCPF
jgi:hypothetical protein